MLIGLVAEEGEEEERESHSKVGTLLGPTKIKSDFFRLLDFQTQQPKYALPGQTFGGSYKIFDESNF